MAVRTVEVPIERIGRWITNFARRHDGATLLGTVRTNPALTNPTTADDDATPSGQRAVLQLHGGDGEVAEFGPWPPAGTPADPAGPAGATLPGDLAIPAGPAPSGGASSEGAHAATLARIVEAITAWCAPPEHLGLILIRRGGYAVGRADGSHLRSHKSGTRYVQSRTAAGGWSQQRFARRRRNQADALVGTVAELAAAHLLPGPVGDAPALPEALVLGGDRALIQQVLSDPALASLTDLPQRTFADLPEPRFAVLEQALRRGRSIPVRIIPGQ